MLGYIRLNAADYGAWAQPKDAVHFIAPAPDHFQRRARLSGSLFHIQGADSNADQLLHGPLLPWKQGRIEFLNHLSNPQGLLCWKKGLHSALLFP